MTRNHLTEAQRADAVRVLGPRRGWGYGLAVDVATGAYGWDGGLGTSWVSDPASGLTAILLTQTAFASPDPPVVHREFQKAVFGG